VRARITRSIVGVTAMVVVVLGVPLAILVQRFYESRTEVELQRAAAQAVAELTVPLQSAEIARAAHESDAPRTFTVYDAAGSRLFGPGPAHATDPSPGDVTVTSPITDRTTELVVGSVRVSRRRDAIAAEARRVWAVMALGSLAGIALAFVVARREAQRLSDPITVLAARAARLGSDDEDDVAVVPSGIRELDALADALTLSTRRLAELVVREREFSANASHQLRTPLAGLKASLERGDHAGAVTEVDRLSETVDHLLALARDGLPAAHEIDVAPLLRSIVDRWAPIFRGDDRALEARIDADLPAVRIRRQSMVQALDAILDNALHHGAGTTRLTARGARGGLAVQIDDDGPGILLDRAASVFERHEGSRTGIGLALARTLVEADGGRLLLADPERAEFRIVLVAAPTEPSGSDVRLAAATSAHPSGSHGDT
jgi:signal transduction histidine kinase